MNITRAGLGTWAIGGPGWAFGWGAQDDAASIATIRHAVERGLNWIDTAAVYGVGHAEEVVGRALRDIPRADRPYVFTKCSLVWDENDHSIPPHRDGSPASLRREVEASLRRLQLERLDLYQMHWPADNAPLEVYWQTLLDLKREGKVRAVGLSNHDAAQLEAAEKLGHVDTLQPPFSAIRREVAAAELPWCAAHKTGVICYSVMQCGLLSGSFRLEALPQNDWRARGPDYNKAAGADFAGEPLRQNLALAEALKPIAARHGVSQAAIAVAWALAWPGVTAAIVGARRPAQVDGWFAATTLELSQADMQQIADAIASTGAGAGPALPPRG
jgi:aryl-alcohol dehydrogenase-like predicted oxidoreductase